MKHQHYYIGNIQPDDDVVFVFGSNPEGRHGAGSAKVAHDVFGAQYGVGEGLTGNAYALPTKDLRVKENYGYRSIPLETITQSVRKLYETARKMPEKRFLVAYRNKMSEYTLNGYNGMEMRQTFIDAAPIPQNVVFSEEWYDSTLEKYYEKEPLDTDTSIQTTNFEYEDFCVHERRLTNQGYRWCDIDGNIGNCQNCPMRKPEKHTVTLSTCSTPL